MVGDEASKLRSMLEVSYPMENGMVRNWEDMCHVWDYTFGPNKMNIDAKNCKVLLTDPPMNPLKNREKMIEVIFCLSYTVYMSAIYSTYYETFYILDLFSEAEHKIFHFFFFLKFF